jgi:hypothetical protein
MDIFVLLCATERERLINLALCDQDCPYYNIMPVQKDGHTFTVFILIAQRSEK